MAKIRDIQRTAAFAWAPDTSSYIATGTQAGAVSADFSDNTQLELWDLDLAGDPQAELSPITAVNTDSKFYDIAWGGITKERPRGIIAGGLENGSLDLWDAEALINNSGDALISQTKKHSGAIKALQFNHFSPNILATAGAQGELHIWNLENMENTFRLGNKAARADDFDCLDWNKKVPHIVVTGGSGGFLTVWDVKQKRESLTLNNLGRKAVSAVAWHPEQQTKLITAVPDDTNPVILVWDLKNSNAPERILSGHNGGVLSLSWCKQDPDLLLSCGKDNRTICWNPNTGEMLGDFPVVTNWTFKTSFNPRNPSYSATASYDGKIVIRTLQNTNPTTTDTAASADGEDFFSQASNAQASSFTLKQTPRWLKRTAGATFGFGGKLVSFNNPGPKQNAVKISTVNLDSGVTAATERFEKALQEGNLVSICDEKAQDAKNEEEKSEWSILRALFENDTKAKVIEYLGFKADDITPAEPATPAKEDKETEDGDEDAATKAANRLSTFFGTTGDDSDNFLADLSIQSSQTARTNNPFKIYTGEETDAERAITKALVLGRFDKAVDVALAEDRMTDALMLAICGGEQCIEKVKAAYFTKMAKGPNYLRILASITGKNLWDVVHNADLSNWQEVMVSICTYADDKDFGDLCEALGDRLEEEYRSQDNKELRQHASLCYLAGSKLHKVVNIWIAELHETEQAGLQEKSDDSTFSVHARSLQQFIEKVTVFRQATKFVDDEKNLSSGWKLNALYEKYNEYADVVAAHGQLNIAGKYLDLLPNDYPAASAARERIKRAIQTVPAASATTQAGKPKQQQPITTPFPSGKQQYQPRTQQNQLPPTIPPAAPVGGPLTQPFSQKGPYTPAGPAPGYQPPGYTQPQTSYPGYGGGYASNVPTQPPRTFTAPPPKANTGTANWNDTPEVVRPSRRGTPSAPQPSTSPFPGAPVAPSPQLNNATWGAPPKPTPPPPPKGALPPNRAQSPAIRTQSPGFQTGGTQMYGAPPAQTPYSAPPPSAPPTGRYTPQQPPPQQAGMAGPPGATRSVAQGLPPPPQGAFAGRTGPPPSGPQYAPPPQLSHPPAPSPYAPQTAPSPYAPQAAPSPYAPQAAPSPYAPQAAPSTYAPPPASQPPPMGRPVSQHAATPPPKPASPAPPAQPKHPKGDRSHIPPQHMPIFEILSSEMEKVKARAPPAVARQVQDTEKRLNILFDHLNNEEVLQPDTLEQMGSLAQAMAEQNYTAAKAIQIDLVTHKTNECNPWLTGVKRLIEMAPVAQ